MALRHVSVLGYLDQIEIIGRLIEECAFAAGFDDRANYQCQLAIGEACENIIIHGYGGEGMGEIDVTVQTMPGEITVELRDDAPPFDAAQKPEEVNWSEEDPPIGGLGLLIIHRVMDKIEYRRFDNQNYLKLRKTVSSYKT
jgi:anti-sigma regulatory factor (Ser/Thr protein kinase)